MRFWLQGQVMLALVITKQWLRVVGGRGGKLSIISLAHVLDPRDGTFLMVGH